MYILDSLTHTDISTRAKEACDDALNYIDSDDNEEHLTGAY